MIKNDKKWLSPVPKQSLSKMVVDKIKEAIIEGDLKPGDYLPPESELVESFGVGKSSVREAVKMLEAIGIVEIIKGNGSKIKNTANSDMLNPLVFQLILESHESQSKLLEFRTMIEVSASSLAVKNATRENIESLKSNIELMENRVSKGESTIELDLDFHRILFESTQNPFVVCVGNAVIELFKASMVIANSKFPHEVIRDHKLTLEALENRDEKQIEKVTKEYLNRWGERALPESKY